MTVDVSLTLCCFVVYSTRRFVVCLSMCHFVLVFFSPFNIAITSLGGELILVLFVRLFDLCLFGLVGFLFLLGSGKGCGLLLWHSLDFSLTYFWAHYYEPENKAQSRKWVGPGSPRPKKFKTQPSAGRVIDTVFLDAKRRYYVGRLTQEKYNNWTVQCKLVRPAENRHP